jgi:esterase
MSGEPGSVTDELIELNGLRFHYRDWHGPSEGARDVLILPGVSQTSRAWDRVASALSDAHRVFVLDHRGHGESQWAPPDEYGLDFMVADVEAFVAALGLRGFALIGHSMGGNVGFGYAGKRPPELDRFVIEDISPETPDAALTRILTMLKSQDVFDSPMAFIERAVAAAPQAHPEEISARTRHNLMRMADGKWTWRWDRAFRDPSRPFPPLREAGEGWALVANINVPCLVVQGETSDLLPNALAARLRASIKDCRLIQIAGAGHGVHSDQPAAFLEAIRPFLAAP